MTQQVPACALALPFLQGWSRGAVWSPAFRADRLTSASLRSSSSLGARLLLFGGKGLGLVGVLGPFCPAGATEAQDTQLKSQAGATGLPGWLHLAAGPARPHPSLGPALGTRLLRGETVRSLHSRPSSGAQPCGLWTLTGCTAGDKAAAFLKPVPSFLTGNNNIPVVTG